METRKFLLQNMEMLLCKTQMLNIMLLESDPVEEIPANDLSMEATDQVAIPVVESGEASSDKSSRLARTLEEIQKRQDEQSSLNAVYSAFIVRQEGHNNEVQEMLAKILSRLGPS